MVCSVLTRLHFTSTSVVRQYYAFMRSLLDWDIPATDLIIDMLAKEGL